MSLSTQNRANRSSSSRVPIVDPMTESCRKNTRVSSAGGAAPVVAPATTTDPPGLSDLIEWLQVAAPTVSITRSTRSGRRAPASKTASAPSSSAWTRFWREAWAEVKQLVRVQHMQQPEVPLLTPSQSFFLRENLKLRLLGARLALLSRDQVSYKSDLKAAREWLIRYYDTREKTVSSAMVTLRNLHESDINIEMPDIAATLDALRNLRVARERPAR